MRKKQKKKLQKIIISGSIFAFVFVLYLLLDIFNIYLITDKRFTFIIPITIYFSLYIYLGYEIIFKVGSCLKEKKFFDDKVIIVFTSLILFCFGGYYSFMNKTIHFFPSGFVMMLMYQIIIWLDGYRLENYRKKYDSFSSIKPDFVLKKINDNYESQIIESIKENDIVLIKANSIIPFDGVVVKGKSEIDFSKVLNDFTKITVKEGSKVNSGNFNNTADLEIQVTSKFEDTFLKKIISYSNFNDRSSNIEKKLKKIYCYYSKVIILLALIIGILPSILSKNYMTWIPRGINILVISCMFQLVSSISYIFSYGLTDLAINKVLVKNSKTLEDLSNANIFVFDKSGTLTKGEYEVTNVFPQKDREKILRLACEAEFTSLHPIAKAIRNAYLDIYDTTYEIESIPGLGVIAKKDDNEIICGNRKLLKENNIEYIPNLSIGTIIYVAHNKKFIGSIVVSDEIREEASSMLSHLTVLGYKNIMLTGDNNRVGSDISDKLMLTDFKASLLEKEKIEEIKNIEKHKSNKDVICYVGDGNYDVDIFKESDIAISIGKINNKEIFDFADIIILDDDLNNIALSINVAKKVINAIHLGLFLAFITKLVILILALFDIIDIWISILLESIVTLIIMLLSMKKYNLK